MRAPRLTPGEWLKVANALTVEAEKLEEHAKQVEDDDHWQDDLWMREHLHENLLDGAKERRVLVSRIITAMKEDER